MTMQKKTSKKKITNRKKAAKPERREGREGMNIKQLVVRSAIRQGFRMLELGALAIGGSLLGMKISF
jgi:hypothetical protein